MKPIHIQPLIILILVAALMMLAAAYVLKSAAIYNKNTVNNQASTMQNNIHSKEIIEWKLATSWPKGFPGLGTAPKQFAENIKIMSKGRLQIKVYGAKELVPALGVFDAVSQGSIEVGHTGAYYWKGKSVATPFFTTIPFGMTAQEMNAWLYYGGGIELWRELYAPFNIVPLAGGNTGVQMAGWFNKEINTLADLQGLKMRIPGIAGEVFTRIGGTAVNIAGGDLYTSLKTGVIDAAEWVGPYNDLAMGFHETTKYYYYPGWHEPGPTLEIIVNKTAYESLSEDLRTIVDVAARAANQSMLDEYTARNNSALKELVDVHHVQLRKLPDEVLLQLKRVSAEVLQEMVADDPMATRVYTSYMNFAKDVKNYHHISEQAYINARDLGD